MQRAPRGARSGPTYPRWLLAIGAALGAQALLTLLAPAVPLSAPPGFTASFLLLCALVVAVGGQAPAAPPSALPLLLVPLALLLVATWVGAAGGLLTVALVTAALLLGGTLVGGVVGARVQQRGHLWIVGAVASIADVWSVLGAGGPSRAIAADARLLSLAALSFPILGTSDVAPFLGVGDVVVVSLFLVAARRLELGVVRASLALFLAFAVVLVLLLVTRRPVPALPVLCAAFVSANPRVWTLRREDRRPALIGLLAVVALFCVLWLVR